MRKVKVNVKVMYFIYNNCFFTFMIFLLIVYHLQNVKTIEYFHSIIILIPLLKNVLDGLSTYGSYGFQIPNNDENILGKNLH